MSESAPIARLTVLLLHCSWCDTSSFATPHTLSYAAFPELDWRYDSWFLFDDGSLAAASKMQPWPWTCYFSHLFKAFTGTKRDVILQGNVQLNPVRSQEATSSNSRSKETETLAVSAGLCASHITPGSLWYFPSVWHCVIWHPWLINHACECNMGGHGVQFMSRRPWTAMMKGTSVLSL